MNFGDFARVANAGVDSYFGMSDRLEQRAAKAAAARALLAGDQGMQAGAMTGGAMTGQPPVQPPAPGQPSAPAAPPQAGPPGMPPGAPPQGGPPPALANLGGGPPGAMPPAAGGLVSAQTAPRMVMPPGGPLTNDVRPPMPDGAPTVSPATATAPQQGQDPNLSGVADPTGNVIGDISKTLGNMAQQIAKANPGIKPRVLYDAMAMQIDQIKGMNPEAQIYARMSIADKQMQSRIQEATIRATSVEDAMRIKTEEAERYHQQLIEAQKEIARIRAEAQKEIARIRADASIKVGAGHDSAHVAGAQVGADARRYAADRGVRANAANGGNTLKTEKQLEGTALGKAYATSKTALAQIDKLATGDAKYTSPSTQLGLINRYLYLTTGSTRPPLAEVKNIISHMGLESVYDVNQQRLKSGALLSRQQVDQLVEAAQTEGNATIDAARNDPVTGPVIKRLESGDQGGAGGERPPVPGAQKAPDGSWVVKRGGQWFRVDQ
jgi:hypothetical protein